MRPRAEGSLPVTLLLLALAAFMAGCTSGPPVSAAENEGAPFATSASALAQGIPVTGFGLEVIGCDPRGTFLNFRLSPQVTTDSAAKLQVEFNGRAAPCRNPLGDPSILSCSFPPLTLFPVLVVVRTEDAVLTEFTYDSASCPAGLQAQAEQSEVPSLVPLATGTAVGLPAPSRTPQWPGIPWTLSPTLTPVPASPTEPQATPPPATEPQPTQPSVTDPPPTEPSATEPPATEPPSTQPPATDPPPTSVTEATPKPPPTHKPTPTRRPTPTPKPTHTTEPQQTEPPTQPAPIPSL